MGVVELELVVEGNARLRHDASRCAAERLDVADRVENLHRQLAQTDRGLDVARDQQAVYDTCADKHHDDLTAVKTIGYVIDAYVEQLVAAYHDNPPAYLAALGTYPDDGNQRSRWDHAAQTVEHYRHRHHMTDEHNPLGRPLHRNTEQQHGRERFQEAAQELTHGASRDAGLDLGIEL